MANKQKGQLGQDGYKELYAKEKAVKRTRNAHDSPIVKKLKQKEKEALKIRAEEIKKKQGEFR